MNVGQQVSGVYCGSEFRGVIQEMRAITVKTDGAFEFDVKLNDPVTIFGTQRDRLLVVTRFDGSPSSYTKFDNQMQAA